MAAQMETVNVRISKRAHRQLAELATANHQSMQSMIDRAVEAYRRQSFLEALNEDFARLQQQPETWQEECSERNLWQNTVTDGLVEEPSDTL